MGGQGGRRRGPKRPGNRNHRSYRSHQKVIVASIVTPKADMKKLESRIKFEYKEFLKN